MLSNGQSAIVPSGLGSVVASQPNRTTAVLEGNLLGTGGQNPTVKIVWGDEDAERMLPPCPVGITR